MSGLEKFLNKNVKVIYKDVDNLGRESASTKIGKLIDSDADFIYILSSNKDIAIPKSTIKRIEVETI